MTTIINFHGLEVTVYSTKNDAVQAEIIDPIEATGEASAAEFDIDAIANAVLEFHDARDEQGTQRLDEMGYYPDVDEQTFWAVVERNIA